MAQPKGLIRKAAASNGTAVETAKRPIDRLKAILAADSVQEQFRNVLQENAGAFIASIIDLYNTDHLLQACDPKDVVMEALKGKPYQELLHGYREWERGGVARLDPREAPLHLSLDPSFAAYEVQLELSPYRGYGVEEMLQAVVRVREDGKRPWLEKATLFARRGNDHDP